MTSDLTDLIRTIPDFPKPGIQLRDITTLLADGEGLRDLTARLADIARPLDPDLIVGIEARGFILGAALAFTLGKGFVPVRKKGKLPGKTVGIDYVLEYGTDRLELHEGQVPKGARVVLVDDLIATGGTAVAAAQLLREQGASVLMALFAVDLPDLGGMAALAAEGVAARAIMAFAGE
ncbi:MAG: adenine phosphoribosyltransferase [Sphingobium sp.]|uniref:adenine phosphoribosyltransferase n=1 Tax=Sphingobium sp. TaxID=1912891 RepID=UPI000C6048FF|nr:adenine phosphoribosyltransferase [Sphingobium sp.]MBU0657644.1 adenine phosphoribosyltransferase [Alphaproteobacteria bacterium]MBA4753439.1 adenine phosphoribosyltransferase [Sphingobium sp.]MBS88826.1 adenine phosphoribosyltransferase [Sphingobium sp.]MBU0867334.1 adenine phosphoribosyltransferase [Alphaproteobacteria bacterium]MBU1794690.1 adenine phosphoribosyltransferase [Alphaproteobacteria bacterium]